MSRVKGGRKPERTPLEARLAAFEKPTQKKAHEQHRPGSQKKGRNGS